MSEGPTLEEIHSTEEIRARIRALAERLLRDYPAGPLKFLVIAEGARRFAGALVDALGDERERVETVIVRARRTRGTELVGVEVDPIDARVLEAADVLVLDDIADEGRTLEAVLSSVRTQRPRSVRVAVLVSKQERRRVEVPLDYVGFQVKHGWVVGFGMDLEGRYRDLDYLAIATGRD